MLPGCSVLEHFLPRKVVEAANILVLQMTKVCTFIP